MQCRPQELNAETVIFPTLATGNGAKLREEWNIIPARATSKESAIRQHAEKTTHDIHPRYGEILERNETNYKRRIFLESLHSNIDKNSVNEKNGVPVAVKISWEPKYKAVILNFRFIVEEEPEIRFENLGTFVSLDQF